MPPWEENVPEVMTEKTMPETMPDTLERFRDLRLRALRDAPDAFGATSEASADRDAAYWRGWITGEGWDGEVRSWVAEDRGTWRAMAVGARFDASPTVVHLFGMWVEPALRGSGIASRLVGTVAAWAIARGAERLRLAVSDGNDRAETFYAKQGFVRTGEDATPLREGSTVLVHAMERVL